MKIQEANPRDLYDRSERAQAKLARIARGDCWHGGARAMVLANRLDRMGSTVDYHSVVSEAYTSSTGTARSYLAYSCPECGCVVQGIDNAAQCCAEN